MTDFLADAAGLPIDVREYTALRSIEDYGRVARTDIGKEMFVSTIWLGVPMLGLYETMVFRDEESVATYRWDTLEAAEVGHNTAVLIALTDPVPETLTELWAWRL